jgi:hypothetical protein
LLDGILSITPDGQFKVKLFFGEDLVIVGMLDFFFSIE